MKTFKSFLNEEPESVSATKEKTKKGFIYHIKGLINWNGKPITPQNSKRDYGFLWYIKGKEADPWGFSSTREGALKSGQGHASRTTFNKNDVRVVEIKDEKK